MFFLLTIEDKILLDPSKFRDLIKKDQSQNSPKKYNDIVYLLLRDKYISKIILDQGLVISIKSFKIKSDLIVEIEGVIDIKYECTLLIFCPKEGEILYGKIIESEHSQITIDCELIKVKVSNQQLMNPCFFNTKEKLWFWSFEGKNYYYEKEQKCRLKVIYVNFKSKKELAKMINNKLNNDTEDNEENKENFQRDDIMEIYCSMGEEGLGPVGWWEQ